MSPLISLLEKEMKAVSYKQKHQEDKGNVCGCADSRQDCSCLKPCANCTCRNKKER
ncbi:MAG TPA: hypothetical protein PKJ10_06890 [Smithella sp.]|nr:hypothetical protein [Smithella sp.]